MKKMLLTLASFFCVVGHTSLLFAQDFAAGGPLGATNQAGTFVPMSDNVKVYGSFHFTESCTFDPERNLILSMNRGNDAGSDDGYVSLINPDGSVHTSKWIGATRDGLELRDPIGSAISNGILYTADNGSRHLRSFDLETGEPMNSISIPGSGFINGVAATAAGTAYLSDTPGGIIYEISADGDVSVFTQGAPLNSPNGVAMDNDGNIVVVNIGDAAVITYDPSGEVVKEESAVEGGNDGVVVLENGIKYVSSVRFGSVSRIDSSGNAQLIARGIPSAASMCYDSRQNQLVIPMNPHYAMAFIPL
jgi:hypothetical protein|tara:strand:+ start:3378 stop:4292 length:915 start_codon:yes stop_codon:yes gene_type:complete